MDSGVYIEHPWGKLPGAGGLEGPGTRLVPGGVRPYLPPGGIIGCELTPRSGRSCSVLFFALYFALSPRPQMAFPTDKEVVEVRRDAPKPGKRTASVLTNNGRSISRKVKGVLCLYKEFGMRSALP